MRVIPRTTPEFLAFCKLRADKWLADPAALGLPEELALEVADAYAAAEAARSAQREAYASARAASVMFNSRMEKLRRAVGNAVRMIRAYADTQPGPAGIYAAAALPPPNPASPLPAPGTPRDPRWRLFATGELELRWDCDNPEGSAGTIYLIRRRMLRTGGVAGGQDAFEFLAAVADRRFVDTTLPPGGGTGEVQYQITAQRSGKSAPPGRFTVCFGSAGGTRALARAA